jgi:Protein of unknown function (DUF3465)
VKHYLKHLFGIIFILSLLVACKQSAPDISDTTGVSAVGNVPIATEVSNQALTEAYKNKKSDIFVEGSGVVKKLLADDNKGSRHQKFLVTVSAEQTLLFAHNIDLAPRVENLQIGDAVTFRGEYVYNPKGGVMHWTHKDPQGEIKAPQGGNKYGWIKHNGQKYE